MTTTLHFLFVGYSRPWRPLPGVTPAPKGEVYVLRSLPGNVVAGGATMEEAQQKLQRALERAFEREGGDGRVWYRKAVAAMTDEDHELRRRLWESVWDQGVPVVFDHDRRQSSATVMTTAEPLAV